LPMALLWAHPGPGLLMMPACIVILLLLALGIGLVFAALMVSYRDVQFILPVLIQLLMFASPVAYSAAYRYRLANHAAWVLGKYVAWLPGAYMLNPLAGVLEAFKWSMLGEGQVDWKYLGYSALVAVAVFLWGAFTFKRMERKFADVV